MTEDGYILQLHRLPAAVLEPQLILRRFAHQIARLLVHLRQRCGGDVEKNGNRAAGLHVIDALEVEQLLEGREQLLAAAGKISSRECRLPGQGGQRGSLPDELL